MKVRKAIIPAVGLDTRFLPVTKAQPKTKRNVTYKKDSVPAHNLSLLKLREV